MTEQELAALRALRDKGYAVCVFAPCEMRGADQSHVEDRLVELGWDVIDCLATEPSEEN